MDLVPCLASGVRCCLDEQIWSIIGERDREGREAQVGDLDGFGARENDLKRRFLANKGGFLPEASLDVDLALLQHVALSPPSGDSRSGDPVSESTTTGSVLGGAVV